LRAFDGPVDVARLVAFDAGTFATLSAAADTP
jgi:hypothetical protein